MSKKTPKGFRISARVDKVLKERMQQIEKERGIPEAELVRECVKALCEFYEKNGYLVFPLCMSPKGLHISKDSIGQNELEDSQKKILTSVSQPANVDSRIISV